VTAHNPLSYKPSKFVWDITDYDEIIMIGDHIAAILYADLNYYNFDL